MKFKRRRVLEVPPNIKSFISSVTSVALENIEIPLRDFVWEFDKGDFHHWIDLFTHFDSFFEKFIKPRKDLQLEDNFLEGDPPFPREAVLQILRVTRIILENCTNKHFYSSFEHLSSLLASSDADVVEASLHTLTAFLKKTVGKCSIRDASLTSKLFAFSQGWGGKEEGLGLIACSLQNGCDLVASEIGSTLHFEFYSVPDTSKESNSAEHENQGLHVIHMQKLNCYNESDLELLHKLVKEYGIPPSLRFSLLTRLRFARAFDSLAARHQYICIQLYAFIVLVQASNDADDMAAFFNNEPEFINELLSLLSYEDEIPEEIRILGILSLVALCQDRSQQPTVLSSVTAGGHRGILPSLMQKAVDSITSGSTKWSIDFAEALLSLVSILVSSTPGSLALQEAGFIPTILPLIKDTNPQHLRLVSTAVHVIEGFLDFHNPSSALFRDLGGLDDTIARLKIEVSHVEKGSKKNAEEPRYYGKGKQVVGSSAELEMQPLYSEDLVSYHRRLLMKALLRTISLASYVPGSSARVDGAEESVLPSCLCIVFRRAKDFGGGVFSLAANVMSDLIHKDPTCFPALDAADLPLAFLDAITSGVLCSAEAVMCIPQCLDALCLNNTGLQLVKDHNALKCFVKIFTSRSYLRVLSGETPGTLSNGLDELMRHASSLRASGVDMLIEILNTISKIGSGLDPCSSTELMSSAAPVPMETDLEERKPISLGEGETSNMGNSEQMNEVSSDNASMTIESFLPECISNAARLLETILQNADTCRVFIDKKGIEAVLKLFTLQFLPISVSVGQSISIAFKNFSPQHSAALSKAVCCFIRDHLKLTNELLTSVCGTKLADIDCLKQPEVLKCLSSLEGLLSLCNFLLKGTTTMVSELGSADADILKELGKAYKEIMWQISLCSDSNIDEKQDADQEAGTGESSASNVAGRESDDDGNIVPVVRYMNPISIRNTSSPHWTVEQDFVSVVRSAGSMHRHGRHALSRIRGGRISRQMDASHTYSESSLSTLESSLIQDTKKRSPDILVSELLTKLGLAMRSFLATLVKGLSARRRGDSGSLSPASKSLVTALAKLFLDSLSYSGHSISGLEMSLSVKCRYLGKVVEDMAALIFDSRRQTCNTALVNSFYVNGTFKELLTTYEATSQLLWTLPFSIPTSGSDQGPSVDERKHSSWLLDTLQSYCRLLEYHVNSSSLLSPTSASQSQLLVQPVAAGLSINLFSVPRDPEAFVRMLQSQVLDVILPVWNHPMFPNCNPSFVSSVISIITHVYSGVGDLKRGRNGITGSTGQRLTSPPLDESTVATIVEMGFTRARAEEALRSVGTNSVEMATDWLFSHPEEFVQEDVQLAQALALSLGNSSETSKGDSNDKTRNAFAEERGVETPPIDDVLCASMKLFQSSDSMAFPLTDLLVTLCNRNKGEDRPRVTLYLIQQLKLCPSDFSKEIGALCPISHILALLLSEDSSTREIAAENGVVSVVLDILTNFRVRNESRNEPSATRTVSALLLIIDNMLQSRPKFNTESAEGSSRSLSDSSEADISIANPSFTTEKKSVSDGLDKESGNVFEKILGKSTGYLSLEESQRALAISCELIKQHVPAVAMQAVLQLCARLTKTHGIATQFLETGGLAALFSLPRTCIFPGFDSLASAIIRHLIEDPQTLQTAMELEIRQTLAGTLSRHAGRLSPRIFLTSMAPVISRDPEIFMRAAAAVCQLETSGGRTNIREKEKDKDKLKGTGTESGVPSNEPVKMPENRPNDTPGKCSRSHKRVPANLSQVIDQLLEIVMSFPSAKKIGDGINSPTPMEVDEPTTKEKGKSKVDETKKMDGDNLSERSALLAKLTFVLKLMSDILLMYVHAVSVILKRDMETCQLRGSGLAGGPGNGGVVHHILHQLLPLSSEKAAETSDEWKDKLSEKASWFLVVLCGRSTEGRRRVISEIVKTFSSFLDSEGNSSKSSLLPDKKVLAFADLVNSILSRNSSSSNLPGPGCSPDIAKAMIDGGMVQSLSGILQVIDLDHPDAPKVVNLILKALESLTRAANASNQVLKLDGLGKKRSSATHGRTEGQATAEVETANHDQNANDQHEANVAVQPAEQQIHESSQNDRDHGTNAEQSMEQDMRVDGEENIATNAPAEHELEYMREEMDEGGALRNSNEIGMTFRVEHQTDDDMGNEDEEDIGEDGEDDDEDEEDEDEDIAEEGAALMSLADTDAEDHDDNGMGDEYNDDMLDDEDDDFPENRVIEVRWRDGLSGLDHLRVLRGPGDASGFIDIAAETFQGVDADDIYRLHIPLGMERRRPSSSRTFLDRSRLDGNAFQHPLLVRPSQSGEPVSSLWSASGNLSRDLEALSFGGFDVAHFYMLDAGLPSGHAAATMFGDRLVSAAPPPLIDFSLVDSLNIGGRRRAGDSRWTDDGLPQAGSHAATIAQAVEEQFVSQLHGLISVNDPPAQRQSEHSFLQANQQSPLLNANSDAPVAGDLPTQPSEGQHQDLETGSGHQLGSLPVEVCIGLPNLPHGIIDAQSIVGAEESQGIPEIRQRFPDDLNVAHNGSETMHDGEGPVEEFGPTTVTLDTIPEINGSSNDLQTLDHPMQDGSEAPANPHNLEFHDECREGPSVLDSHSSSHALISSGSGLPELSDAHAGSVLASADVDMNGADTVEDQFESPVPASSNGVELSARQNATVPQDANQADQVHANNEASSTNAIDPTFLEALPEDLRAEVLASQQISQPQSAQAATYVPPPAEEIDPEFLAALPPDIQAEVLAQQRAQRSIHSQPAEGQPVDMDNASIIATFPPDLREEVLLTSSEAVLSALPSALLAEAQMLRDRYHPRSSLFGGGHRLGGRRLAIDRHTAMDRGVGVTIGRRAVSATANSSKVKEIEGIPLLDANALKALIHLLRLAQPLGKGLLQRLLLNLCAHSVTRSILVGLLVDMIRPEADGPSGSASMIPQRLYGCQWNVVYGRPQPSDGLPPLVSRRVLEILTYLATNHSSVANILFYFDNPLASESSNATHSENKREKGKEKISEAMTSSSVLETSPKGSMPVVIFLKLLNMPLFLRSNAHLEQVMSLLQVVVKNAVTKIDCLPPSGEAADGSQNQDTQKYSSTSEQNSGPEMDQGPCTEVPSSGGKNPVGQYDLLLQLPDSDLHNLCIILSHEGLSDKVYSLAAEIVKRMASVAPPHRKFFATQLAGLAHNLSSAAVSELESLRNTQMLGLSAGSMAGAAILRVLQALSALTSVDGNKGEDVNEEHEERSILWNLNVALEPLWQELSNCISTTEAKLGQSSTFSSPVPLPDAGDIGGSSSLSPPLPPGTQRLLPFIEAFFVLCEKLQTNQTIVLPDNNVTAREVKEFASTSSSPSLKYSGTGTMTFARVAEKHRRLLNVFIRQNPSLLEKSLSMMLKVPKLIDFDNKRAYFRSRIRQQHDQHPSAPLRISVRRAYVLEDSYNQLRLRPSQDLKGRLTVQFQGEEGIDAGGLTREWYQLLSRVIFDKGALLFTTVGNNATFQPNPNSVYQTEHLSYFKFVGRVVAKALFDGQLLDVYFTRSFYKHILGVKVTYHDIEAVDPDYYKNLKWMLENDVSDIPDLTFSMDADEEKHILYEKNQVTDYELIPGGRNIRVTEETKHEYVDLVAEHILSTAIRPQINSFLEGFSELVPRELISIFNGKELELLISGLPEIDFDDLKANTEYTGYTGASPAIQWFWEVVKAFSKEDMARLLQFVTGTSKVPLEGFKALQGISGPQRFQIHKAYGAPERLPSAHTCFNQLDLPEYPSKEQLEERLLLAIHEANEGFGFG
ncbi:E3 ubiquitin-protein ligase UPL1-like isoform X2 [Phoenix dactylifera]|uniref:HECT-type E3 ubiquitin transferase n=1 Tax=Phoenix dactylifera TaxID=42345 RepID=A0A8B9ACX1_PHODC|nr:E3 ubiquitin-protein ligase UPL1-like isoform X2 [Phoenix dactylifera]